MLSYLSTELHIAFKPFWHNPSDLEKAEARDTVGRNLDLIADNIRELYLFGPRFTTADAYLFAMLRWAQDFDIPMPTELYGYFERVAERPAVRQALAEEGLVIPETVARESIPVATMTIG